jgi:hypothetical protein
LSLTAWICVLPKKRKRSQNIWKLWEDNSTCTSVFPTDWNRKQRYSLLLQSSLQQKLLRFPIIPRTLNRPYSATGTCYNEQLPGFRRSCHYPRDSTCTLARLKGYVLVGCSTNSVALRNANWSRHSRCARQPATRSLRNL